MKIDGVWKIQMRGPYGKQTVSTAFLKKGSYLAASADHYAIGSYKAKDGVFKAKMHISRFGQTPPIFGSKKREIDIVIKGKINKSGEKIIATSHLEDSKKFVVGVQLSRLGDLD